MLARPITGLIMGAVLALGAVGAQAQDELRVRQLENEVSRLQRELDAQSRRIDELERNLRGTTTRSLPPAPPDAVRRNTESSPAWLVVTNWDRVKPGMKDIDVIALLGRPTTVRPDPDGKGHSLMYALELGPNAVLAGNVRLDEKGVAQVTKPTLR
ncbi:MAG TPA: hypothetical protein VFS52_21065 [Steroidobacteraceae bacterium]|jgi:hypothetical protein|nr:hypothetical protein [Steroidobacteraceae bacterium]